MNNAQQAELNRLSILMIALLRISGDATTLEEAKKIASEALQKADAVSLG